ncbi:hypothetical protein ISN45_Aa07g039640 [Arabidopsis thaliana x Arabidopsis arenosa]|uniref:DUF4283 domain-containing protein n=1 Tax=Arabidopsis thaliana x Arabidopsis arenosa TaxID=1240361 RepID=A0A8T1YDR0_9BRAS|nr:hypothetical protein ISN45_Aa07g039640 [Arabidopsis thaliana x Arabidopsis arenosa]
MVPHLLLMVDLKERSPVDFTVIMDFDFSVLKRDLFHKGDLVRLEKGGSVGILFVQSTSISEGFSEKAQRGFHHLQRFWLGSGVMILICFDSQDMSKERKGINLAIKGLKWINAVLRRVIFVLVMATKSGFLRWERIESLCLNFSGSVIYLVRYSYIKGFEYKSEVPTGGSIHHNTLSKFQSTKSFILSHFLRVFEFFWVFWSPGFVSFRIFFGLGKEMTQSDLVNQGSNMSNTMKLKIKVPRFDNTSLIEGYSKTLIGRCMNPAMQDMKSLLFMLPRIWKLEDRVVGADLGQGRFQFDFDHEEDIQEIMKVEPFHFDHWMLSLVRWEPVVDRRYPFLITFWIRVMGVPLHFWADETFRSIGSDLGEVQAVDLDMGRVQVKLDGFKPLCFEAAVEFHSGEETMVSLRYERLFGFCRKCHSLCHEQMRCPIFGDKGKQNIHKEDPKRDNKLQSYKGAAINGLVPGNSSGSNGAVSAESSQGPSAVENRAATYQDNSHRSKQISGTKAKKGRRNPFVAPIQASTAQLAVQVTGLSSLKTDTVGMSLSAHEKKMLEAFLASDSGKTVTDSGTLGANMEGRSSDTIPNKVVCKNLFSGPEEATFKSRTENTLGLAEQHDLFSDDLSQLLAQDFPLVGESSLNFMDTIMEEKESGVEIAHEEGEFKAENEEDIKGDHEGDKIEEVVIPVTETDASTVSVSDTVPKEQEHEEEKEENSQGEDDLETDQPAKRKAVKNKGILVGVSSRKRNYLASPRKRSVPKTGGPTVGSGSLQGEKPPIKH